MSSAQSSPTEPSGGPPCPHGGDPRASSSKKLWRGVQASYLVPVKKHQPKLAALGVHLHRLLSSSKRRRRLAAQEREQDPALTMYLPRWCTRTRASSKHAAPSLSCRFMDPAAAVRSKYQYQYCSHEVEFSCKSMMAPSAPKSPKWRTSLTRPQFNHSASSRCS